MAQAGDSDDDDPAALTFSSSSSCECEGRSGTPKNRVSVQDLEWKDTLHTVTLGPNRTGKLGFNFGPHYLVGKVDTLQY